MTDVVIAGIGQIPVGEHWETSLRSNGCRQFRHARREVPDLEPESLIVGNMMASVISHQANLGALIADWANLLGVEAPTPPKLPALPVAQPCTWISGHRLGLVNVPLVLGVEKWTDSRDRTTESATHPELDYDFEAVQGLTPTGLAALLMKRYLHEYNLPPDALGGFPIQAHANAVHNPNALYRSAHHAGKVCQSRHAS